MPFCPKCGAEYRRGYERCAECDVDLVDKLEPEKEHEDSDYVTLGEWSDPLDMREVCELLEDAEVPCIVQGADAKQMVGIHSGGGGVVLVPADRLEEARDVIGAYLSDSPPDRNIEFLECSECGCPIDPEEDICPGCGAKLDAQSREIEDIPDEKGINEFPDESENEK